MIDITSEQEIDLFLKYGIIVEPDWNNPTAYQASLQRNWVYISTTGETKRKAVHNLKEHLVTETPWLISELSIDDAFDQYIMFKKLGV